MRIYFVGSHATGKTTLCRYVSQNYGLPMISEVARSVLAEMESSFDAMRTDMDLVAQYQRQVFARQVATEKQHSSAFVSDRAFDNLAYAADHTTIFADMVADSGFAEYMKWVSKGVVFFLRPHKSLLVDDGVRSPDRWLQRRFQASVEGLVHREVPPELVAFLPALGDFEARMAWMGDLLSESGTAPGFQVDDPSSSATSPGNKAATASVGG